MPSCKFCNKEIFWMKDGRRNKPHNPDGTDHQCEERQATIESTKSLGRDSLSAEEIAKYEQRINTPKK
jgi:hypothetical protein